MSKFIFKTTDGRYIGMDRASGGYPYETDNLFSAKPWPRLKDAIEYEQHFKERGWRVFEVLGLELKDASLEAAEIQNLLNEVDKIKKTLESDE